MVTWWLLSNISKTTPSYTASSNSSTAPLSSTTSYYKKLRKINSQAPARSKISKKLTSHSRRWASSATHPTTLAKATMFSPDKTTPCLHRTNSLRWKFFSRQSRTKTKISKTKKNPYFKTRSSTPTPYKVRVVKWFARTTKIQII